MAQPRFPVEPGGFRFCQLADALGANIPRRNDPGFSAVSAPEVAMMILIPFKPAILVLGLLTGLIFVGFVGSSLLEGKEPFFMNRGHARHAPVKQDQKVPSVRVQ